MQTRDWKSSFEIRTPWKLLSLASALSLGIATGCGGGDSASNSTGNGGGPAATANQQTSESQSPTLGSHIGEPPLSDEVAAARKPVELPPAHASAQQVVHAFLEATRGGDQQTASALLTRKAIEETTRKGLKVQPPGSASMHYTIGRAEAAPNQGMYVKSLWSEEFDDGTKEEYEVVWILRQEEMGWRIAGMAAQLDPEADPLFIDFEFPEELAKRVNDGVDAEGLANAPYEPPVEQARRPEPNAPGNYVPPAYGGYQPPPGNGYQPPGNTGSGTGSGSGRTFRQ